MQQADKPKELFDRERRRRFRDRAFFRTQGNDFIGQIMANEIFDRLSLVKRNFKRCLLIGQSGHYLASSLRDKGIESVITDSGFASVAATQGIQCDEDRVPFADHSFDLVINVGTLDSVNDLPGALVLTRRLLKLGRFIACLIHWSREFYNLEIPIDASRGDRVAPHIHPQIDIRTVGDLVSRVGLTLPVIDSDGLDLRYREFDKLINDIRDIGGSNALNGNIRPLSRTVYERTKEMFHKQSDADGKVSEHVELIYLCGWAPHPDQPAPARRGSGQVSLKTALNKPKTDL